MRVFLVLTLALLSGCTAAEVRDNILIPLAAEVYEHIYIEIERGLADAVEDGDLTPEGAEFLLMEARAFREALRSGDLDRILDVPWNLLEPWATRGVQKLVDDGKISPAVATSLYRRIVNFRDLLKTLGTPVSWNSTRSTYSTEKVVNGDKVFLGFAPKLDVTWTPLQRHNEPRRALGVPELSANDLGL